MVDPLQLLLGSVSSLIILIGLFTYEDRRGGRVLEKIRTALDKVVDAVVVRWHTVMLYIGGGAGRVWLHYGLHRMLGFFVAVLRHGEASISRLQKRNRKIVRTVQKTRTESHLSAIAAHREATALSETEKKKLKDRSIGD